MSKRHLTPVEKLCKEIIMHGRYAFVTSINVAEHFGKRHNNVVQAIKNLDAHIPADSDSDSKISLLKDKQRDLAEKKKIHADWILNFTPSSYIEKIVNPAPKYGGWNDTA